MDAEVNVPLPREEAVDDGAGFVRKWRGAWPEWSIAETFLPSPERALAPWWQALQFELMESAWGGADARPGEAKLGWWVEELAGWSEGRRRHPLGAVLSAQPAPWATLARALPELAASRRRPASLDEALAQLQPVASAVAAVESALLARYTDAETVAACWLHGRLARHAGGLAGEGVAAAGWSAALLARWPRAHGAATTRRLEAALARARLRAGDAARPRGPLTVLWACWRAARD